MPVNFLVPNIIYWSQPSVFYKSEVIAAGQKIMFTEDIKIPQNAGQLL